MNPLKWIEVMKEAIGIIWEVLRIVQEVQRMVREQKQLDAVEVARARLQGMAAGKAAYEAAAKAGPHVP